MRHLILLLVLLLPAQARAGGFEIFEQSPAGVGMSGAQTAVVDDPGAIFYNPARMTYIRGFSGLAGINVINANTHITNPPVGKGAESNITSVAPTIYGVQRIGSRFAFGVGGFSNFAQIFHYPNDPSFGGRFLGYRLELITATIQPTVAFRPLPWLSIGVGLDVVPASFELRQSLNFGGADGDIHAGATATGVGGNVGLYVRIIPRWLDFGFSYRSAIDLDFRGKAALLIPPELASMAASFQDAGAHITLPHNFSFALGSHLLPNLIVDFDAHVALWSSLDKLTLTLTDPAAPPGTPPTTQSQVLNWRDSYGFRLGVELRLLEDKLRLRWGGGYERTPQPREAVIPVSPDGDRGLVSTGIGYHGTYWGIDVSYLFAYLPHRLSAEPEYRATFLSYGHVFSVGISLHFPNFPKPINEPAFKR